MKLFSFRPTALIGFFTVIALAGCSTPTLIEMSRLRMEKKKDDVTVQYTVTDLDVLNFTNEVKKNLANRSSFHMGVRYGSAGAQATLGTLAGAAQTFGWSVGTASGLGIGAAYIFGMGQIFDSKSHAQAYEQAYSGIQAAEAAFYFQQLGMDFTQDANGKKIADPKKGAPSGSIPSKDYLSPAGETLYYRSTKVLKVLDDVLTSKIPDLEDMKEANGESSSTGSPALQKTSGPSATPPRSGSPSAAAYQEKISKHPVVQITPTPAPKKDLRTLANQIHRDANKLSEPASQNMISAADSYQELKPELIAHPRTAEEGNAKAYLFDLIENGVTDKDGATELKKWRSIIPVHPVATPTPPPGGATVPGTPAPGAPASSTDKPPAGAPATGGKQ